MTVDPTVLGACYRELTTDATLVGSDLPRPLREHEIRALTRRYREHLQALLDDGISPELAIASADAYVQRLVARLADFLQSVERRRRYWAEYGRDRDDGRP